MNQIIKIQAFDSRRDVVLPGNQKETILYCVDHFLEIARESIAQRQGFYVALSGGSTPKAIFEELANHKESLDWSKVYLFWSDERSVPPTDPQSNYKMAMNSAFSKLPLPSDNIFRMKAESDIEEEAKNYEQLILEKVPDGGIFDLIMLGVGEDGHTASLFPKTHGLHSNERLAIANYVPQLDTWRMSLTFNCINSARHIVIYALGTTKAPIIDEIFNGVANPDTLPAQRLGTPAHKALWIIDSDAARIFKKLLKN